jgi:hypothetical protein
MTLIPEGWMTTKTKTDKAHMVDGLWACPADDCERAFLDRVRLDDHAEAVHTFSDTEQMVSEEVREQYGNMDDTDPKARVYVWVQDIAIDWVVFQVSGDADHTTYKASYSMVDGKVTLGEPYEVVRRTVYEPVPGSTKTGGA